MSRVTVGCPICGTLNRVDLARLSDRPQCAGCAKPLHLDRPQPISSDALDQIIADAEVPLVIDFYADWCGPCRMMAPLLDDLARDHAGELLVGKVDTDRHPYAAMDFDVRGIPTLIVFSGGHEVARRVGVVPRSALEELLEPVSAPARSS